MLQELLSWPQKLQDGHDLAHNFYFEHGNELSKKLIKKMVFVGMGGSGIAGRLVKTMLDKKSSVPSFIVDSPQLPAYVDQETLAIVVSYSGNTWETLAGFDELLRRNVPTIVLSHGGIALRKATEKNILSVIVPQTSAPRAALGYFLGFMLGLFDKLGYLNGEQIYQGFVNLLQTHLSKMQDPALYDDFLALCKGRDTFHLWGVRADTDSALFRCQTQFNENSKVHAVTSIFPELCHNLLVGFTDNKQKPLVVIGSTQFLPPKLEATVQITAQILEQEGVALYKVPVLGDNWENQLLYLIVWADFASYYLGLDRKVDITATRLIDELKSRIAAKR